MTASTCIYYLFHHIANDSMSKIQFQCVILIVFLHIHLLLPWGLVERVPACCKSSKFPHPVHAAFQPITNSSRQKHSSKLSSERERAAFSSNLQSHSCLYPPFHFCLSPSPLSADVTSYCSLKFSRRRLHRLQGHLPFLQLSREEAAWLGATGHLQPNHAHDILYMHSAAVHTQTCCFNTQTYAV